MERKSKGIGMGWESIGNQYETVCFGQSPHQLAPNHSDGIRTEFGRDSDGIRTGFGRAGGWRPHAPHTLRRRRRAATRPPRTAATGPAQRPRR